MLPETLYRLFAIVKVDAFLQVSGSNTLTFLSGGMLDNAICQDTVLHNTLRQGAMSNGHPFLHRDSLGSWFAALKSEAGLLYIGPMTDARMSESDFHAFCQAHCIRSDHPRKPKFLLLSDIRNIVLLANELIGNEATSEETLFQANDMIPMAAVRKNVELTNLVLIEEAQDDDAETYRHGYYEEQMLMQAIREGHVEDALRRAERMDMDIGRFSEQALRHWQNLAIIGITLCSRAAIEGGVLPETAYRISGDYIQRCDNLSDPVALLWCRNRAIEELTLRVKDKLNRSRYSGYVANCKDYVRRHYREKLYLADIASHLGITPSYLSTVFKSETGERLSDFIARTRVERAANLLIYTDQSLSSIAQYVYFPGQSYFGRVFKRMKGMTPQAYRDYHKIWKTPSTEQDIPRYT